LRCPEDISVIGFDDIASAAYMCPRLTTVRQPLRRMGEMAVQTLLKRIESPNEAYPESSMFEPELMVRESTGAAPHHKEVAARLLPEPVVTAKVAKAKSVKAGKK
jgi:LacI family transcriptional regulator